MDDSTDLKLITLIGFGAMSGAIVTLGLGNRDWKDVAVSSSLGCFIVSGLFKNVFNNYRNMELVY